ncbi:ABC transporter ATP-binding protein [Phenylobacterium sp.]|uniref:ABC transporter ATP-binding protein n=1 Tax=Phenylobacterium sp. TaxID=1871053 RepID=UPI0035B4F003
MSLIVVQELDLSFPVYGTDARSLKKHVAAATVGGRLGLDGAKVNVVSALRGLSMVLRPGDRLGLVGPNGAGKTTLLRCLAGAYEPNRGRVEVHGRVAAFLDLNLGLDADATGLENVRLRCLLSGMSEAEIAGRMDDIAAFSGLGPYLALPLKTYSAGMTARLAFAAATAIQPDVVLMDEWIAVGDAEFRASAHQRLNEIVERAGILVLASHDLDTIRDHCNKVMRLDAGIASPVLPVEALPELLAA